jgi:hypothetical protein
VTSVRWKTLVLVAVLVAIAPAVATHVASVTVHAALSALEQLTGKSGG